VVILFSAPGRDDPAERGIALRENCKPCPWIRGINHDPICIEEPALNFYVLPSNGAQVGQHSNNVNAGSIRGFNPIQSGLHHAQAVRHIPEKGPRVNQAFQPVHENYRQRSKQYYHWQGNKEGIRDRMPK
jgi:hypothetical protein